MTRRVEGAKSPIDSAASQRNQYREQKENIMRDPLLDMEIGQLRDTDRLTARCWACDKTREWKRGDFPAGLPSNTWVKGLEPRIRCQRCGARGRVRFYLERGGMR